MAGGGAGAAAAGAEAGRAVVGAQPRQAALPQWAGLEPGLCALFRDERETSCEKKPDTDTLTLLC